MMPRSPAPSMRLPAIALLSGFKRAPGRRPAGSLPVQILIHGPRHEAGGLAPSPIAEGAYLSQLTRRQVAGSATMLAPAAEVACPVPGCAAWQPHRQRRKARPGGAAARAGAIAISTMPGHPRPEAGSGQGRLG